MSVFFSSFKHLFVLLITWIIFCLLCLVLVGNTDFSIWINQYHFPFLDIFFKYVTYLGDGLAALLVLILLLVIRLDYGLISAIGFTLSALTTQILKRFVFGEVPRPFWSLKNKLI